MEVQKKKLLIDFDDTICQSVILLKVNSFLGTNYKISEFKDYMIDTLIPEDKAEQFYETCFSDDPYLGVPLIKGAKTALKKLSKVYDIYVCSACILLRSEKHSAQLFSSKYNYLIRELPFLDPKKFIFTASKDVICADILIDDYFHNLRNQNIPKKILFESYHNKQFTDEELATRNVVRGKSWNDICNMLL